MRQKEDITKVSSTFHDIEPQIDALRNSIVERAEIESAANTATQATIKTLITTGLVGVALTVVLFAWLIGRSIAHPVMAITATMKALAAGDKSVKVPGGDRKDEIGAMAAAVVVFKDNMIEADRTWCGTDLGTRGKRAAPKLRWTNTRRTSVHRFRAL